MPPSEMTGLHATSTRAAIRPFVIYWNNIPAPYMVERFNALADRDAFEFEVWLNDRIEADRSWEVDEDSWRFRHHYLPSTCLFGRTQHWPLPVLGRRPDVLVSLYAEPAFVASWHLRDCRGQKQSFELHPKAVSPMEGICLAIRKS